MRRFESGLGWLRTLREQAEVSVVVATWRERGAKVSGPMNASRLDLVLPPGLLRALPAEWKSQRFFEVFPALRRHLAQRAESETVTREAIEAAVGPARIHVEDAFPFGFYENRQRHPDGAPHGTDPYTLRQFYKVFQAGVMKRDLEQEQGARFDAVLRLRPDKALHRVDLSLLLSAGPRDLFTDHFREGAAGDQLAAGSSEALDIYAGFFPHAFRKATEGSWREVHGELHDWLVGAGLTVRPMTSQLGLAPDGLLSVEEVMAVLREAAAGPAPLGPQAAYVLRTLEADEALQAGDMRRAMALARQDLPAPEGIGMSGRLLLMGRALQALGNRRASFLAAALSLVGQPENALIWQGPGSANEELNLLLENAPGLLRPGIQPWAVVTDVAAEITGHGGDLLPLAALLEEPGFRREAEAALADAMGRAARNGGLQAHLSRLFEEGGCPVEAELACATAVELLPHDMALRQRLESLREG